MPCTMLRFGMTCGNFAHNLVVTPKDDILHDIAIMCDMCKAELSEDEEWRKAFDRFSITNIYGRQNTMPRKQKGQ